MKVRRTRVKFPWFTFRTSVLYGESGGHVAFPVTPPLEAWELFAPEVVRLTRKKQAREMIVVGSDKVPAREKAHADLERTLSPGRRRFRETIGAILWAGMGLGEFQVIGDTRAIEYSSPDPERKVTFLTVWQYVPLSDADVGVGWTELV